MKKIGIIGFGNMGLVIGERLKTHSDKYTLFAYDKDTKKTEKIAQINVTEKSTDLVNQSEVVILAVKPQDFSEVLSEIKSHAKDKIIFSVAAGVTTQAIEQHLGKMRIVRVMPNMPARIGCGITCISKGRYAEDDDIVLAKELFGALGQTMILEEKMMNAVTAISGSGPGYFFYLIQVVDSKNFHEVEKFSRNIFIPCIEEAAKGLGFGAEEARILATATAEGSVALLKATHLPPEELLSQIASKGGTTEAAIEVLNNGGSLKQAVKAACRRAEELSQRNFI